MRSIERPHECGDILGELSSGDFSAMDWTDESM
jgi:hypothetical protein